MRTTFCADLTDPKRVGTESRGVLPCQLPRTSWNTAEADRGIAPEGGGGGSPVDFCCVKQHVLFDCAFEMQPAGAVVLQRLDPALLALADCQILQIQWCLLSFVTKGGIQAMLMCA